MVKTIVPALSSLLSSFQPNDFDHLARHAADAYYELIAAVANSHHCLNCRTARHLKHDYPHVRGGPGWRLTLRSVLWAMDQFDRARSHLDGEVYAFGVGGGWTMMLLRKAYTTQRFIGFDSFIGLPEEASDARTLEYWTPGAFNSGDLRTDLEHVLGGPNLVRFVAGFFNTTLTPTLRYELKLAPALYIDIDVDLYISAFQALDYMFGAGLVQVGTIIGYDDWWVMPCTDNRSDVFYTGEGRAHLEITRKYHVRFKCIAGSCSYPSGGPFRRCSIHNTWAPMFLVVRLADKSVAHHGFEMSAAQAHVWRSRSSECDLAYVSYKQRMANVQL